MISTCGGRLVSAPSSTNDNRALLRNNFFYRSEHLPVELICEIAVERLWSIWIEPGTQSPNFLGDIFRTDR